MNTPSTMKAVTDVTAAHRDLIDGKADGKLVVSAV